MSARSDSSATQAFAEEVAEADVRSAFTQHLRLREIARFAESAEQAADMESASRALAKRYGTHPVWDELSGAFAVWRTNPAWAARMLAAVEAAAAGVPDAAAAMLRSLRQAAEITGRRDPVIENNGQDAARWRPPPSRSIGAATGQESGKVLDRLFGPDSTSLDMDAVEAIIATTDELLDEQDDQGDRSSGRDDPIRQVDPAKRSTPVAVEGDSRDRELAARLSALRVLRDVVAEHTRLAENWDRDPRHEQEHIGRLESLMDDVRTAKQLAAAAGASEEDLHAVYRGALTGTRWSELATHLTVAGNRLDLPSVPAGLETTAAAVPDRAPPGHSIGAAIGAALPPEANIDGWSPEPDPPMTVPDPDSLGYGADD
ncbi:hypothetical protein [Nocardia bhagyanarayanae]|uniref:Uncharacterized protein n=1 Tax=Nocardia bhagyanarayanae TaxID=1215925 RepID=A0A543FG04_9NOCA|nr:hypothetical protein [Nocardia bhagyanarayanae]TQM32692.1 hypothetical protein FB390_4387 [Nocardia bhagyanarayanae]